MSIKRWSKMPTEWVSNETVKEFKREDGATGPASLMLFFTLCNSAEVFSPTNSSPVSVAQITYTELGELSSLSRKLVSSGLGKLETVGMITRLGSNHRGAYQVNGLEPGKRWAKLPGRALLSTGKTVFYPFQCFSLRNKRELNAMKLYLYYASIRDSRTQYSEASFETISDRTGVAERNIPAANALLVASELLARIGRDVNGDVRQYEANKYYLTGYKDLANQSP